MKKPGGEKKRRRGERGEFLSCELKKVMEKRKQNIEKVNA